MSRRLTLSSVIALVLCVAALAAGEVRLAHNFQDNMVLQQESPVPVWRWADPGMTVDVAFAGQQVEAEADTAGYWKVALEPLAVNNEGRPLVVRIGEARRLHGGHQGVFCCETGHWCRSGLDPVETLKKVASRIKAFHLKDLGAFDVPSAKDVIWGQGKGRILDILAEVKRQGIQHPYFGIEWERSLDEPLATHATSAVFFEEVAARLVAS
jgi:hypothetical protein